MAIEPGRVKLAPSILTADFANLQGELGRLEAGGADWVHLDVMDGRFVPNISFGPPVVARLREHSRLPFDCHLMIEQPERYVADFARAGCDLLTVHAEACVHLHRVLGQIKEAGLCAGVALNPATPVEAIAHVLDLVDLVLVMSVNPGFGGQSFISAAVPKVRAVRRLLAAAGRQAEVEVDGGVNALTGAQVAEAGATVLVAGNAVFSQADLGVPIGAIRAAAAAGAQRFGLT